jgi:hypothetical protein
MRISILITVITLMATCLAPAFADGEALIAAAESVAVEDVITEPLQLADDQSFQTQQPAMETHEVDYTCQAIEIQPAKVTSLASVLGTDSKPPAPCQVVYTTQSSTPDGGYLAQRPLGVVEAVPEPSSVLALATGIGGILLRPWKRRK